MQRKLLLVTLTVLVSVTMYFSYNLSKKLNTLLKRVFRLEESLLHLQDAPSKSHLTTLDDKISMNIVENQTLGSSTGGGVIDPLLKLQNTRDTMIYDNDNRNGNEQIVSDEESEEEDIDESSEDEDNNEVQMMSSSLNNTSANLQMMTEQLLRLRGHINQVDDIKSDDEIFDEVGEGRSDEENEHYEENEENEEKGDYEENVDEGGGDEEDEEGEETNCEKFHVVAGKEDEVEVEDEDEVEDEVEYIIEYETVSEDGEDENVEEYQKKDKMDEHDISGFVESMSQQHTKNKLIEILKQHELSTFGNKDTLIKRIMTINNFQQYLQA